MLPDDLFIGLIDVDLQNQIAESDDMDKDAMEALATLLNQGNTTLVNNAKDWTTEKFNDKNILFFKNGPKRCQTRRLGPMYVFFSFFFMFFYILNIL